MSFAKVNKPINPDDDFWELNPWLKIHPPYSKLFKKLGAEESSKVMIAVFLMCDPDEEMNPFFRMDEMTKRQVIEEQYCKVDWDDPLVMECLDSYPFDCLTSVERIFQEEKEKLKERAKFIKATQYKLDLPDNPEELDKDLVTTQIRIIDLLEKMAKNTESIYAQYEKVEEKFIQGKSSAIAKGGRRLSRAEKREV